MAGVADKPWLKAYDFGLYRLPESCKPYPRITVGSFVDTSAQMFPDRPAICYLDRVITYKELKIYTDKLANALSQLGVKKGDRVATILVNCPQSVISDFGILKLGAVHVPCSPLHKAPDLIYEIGNSGAETVICMDSSLELVNSIKDRTKLRNIIVTSATDYSPEPSQPAQIAGIYQFRDLLGKYESEPPTVDIDVDEDLAELVFTGGTTGSPKGVMLTHANKVANVCHSAWALSAFEEQLKGQGTWLIGIPLFHQAGQQNMHFCIYWAFEIFLLPDARDIDMLLQLLKKHQPILCSCVPTQYAKLLAKGVGELNTFFTSTTAALPKEVASKFKEETGADIGEAYGMTEAGGGTHSNLSISPLIEVKKIGSIGVPFPDTEVEIIDLETGKEAASGKEGELWVRGPQIMKGYWPETGSGLVDGWLPTGDVVRMDEDGYFYITDRIKDMANVSGMKVYTILVDRVLYEHSAVAEAAAVGIPDPERPTSDRVKAFIRLKEEYEGKVTAEDIIRHCREKLPPYSVPKYVEFRKEFPLGPTGKILKRQLREEEITKSKEVVQ